MVEIINNVTNLKIDEIEQVRTTLLLPFSTNQRQSWDSPSCRAVCVVRSSPSPSQEKEARRLGAPIKKRPPPPGPAPPITQSAAAYFGFGASPSKAKAAPLTPSKKSPRE
jgi:hypothetical protein